jgi:hypothetical protein
MIKHLFKNKILSPHQHGFLSKKSTISQLLECFHAWSKILDRRGSLDIVYLDFAKAFDTVCHAKLLLKLKNYGVDGMVLNWIKAFLSDRVQTVCVDDCMSDSADVLSGVPQGSCLGPLLFVLYINDIVNEVQNASIKLYADDCKLFIRTDVGIGAVGLQEDLNRIFEWACKWQLQLSLSKCNVLPVSLKRNYTINNYVLGNTVLDSVFEMKDLGITISNNLKFSYHINQKCIVAHKIACLIRRVFVTTDVNFLMQMFNTYVRPHLEYGSQVWNPYLTKDITNLENVQRRYTKRLANLRDIPYSNRLYILKQDSLESRRFFNDLFYLYKIFVGKVDINLYDFVDKNLSRTRGSNYKFFKPTVRIDCFFNSFFIRCINTWNTLSNEIIESDSFAVFKNACRELFSDRLLGRDLVDL